MKKFISMVMAAAMVVSLVPATAFAADGDNAAKVVNAIEITSKEATADTTISTYGKPQIQMTLGDVDSEMGVRDSYDVTLKFDGATVVSGDITGAKVYRGEDNNLPIASLVGRYNYTSSDNDTVEFTLKEEANMDIEAGDILVVYVQGELTKDRLNHKATVSVKGDLGTASDLVYASIVDKGLDVELDDKVKDVAPEEKVTLDSIVIEPTVGTTFAANLNNPSEITLKVSKGFEIVSAGVATYVDTDPAKPGTQQPVKTDDNEITLNMKGWELTTKKITISGIVVEATTADAGDVCTLTVKGSGLDSDKVEVAKVVDMKVVMELVDPDEDVPVFYSGVDVNNKGLTVDDDHEALEVTIKETFPGAWYNHKDWTLSLPEGVYVTAVDADEENSTWCLASPSVCDRHVAGEEINEHFEAAYVEGDHVSFEFDKYTFEETANLNVTHELTFTLTLVADPGFVGDVVLTLEGAAVDTQEVTIAKFVSPITVKAEQNDVIIDYRYTEVPTAIVVTEAEAGLWDKGLEIGFVVERGDMIQFEDDATFTVNEESEMEVTDKTGAYTVGGTVYDSVLKFVVDERSDEEAAVVTIDGVELFMQRNIPAGPYDLEMFYTVGSVRGAGTHYNGQALLGQDVCTHTDCDADNGGKNVQDICDYETTVHEAWINVVTAGRDQDDASFTTKIVVPVGETTMYAGEKAITLDVPAYINANDYVMLPVRAVATALGIDNNAVQWDQATKTVIIMYGQRIITMTAGQSVVYVSGTAIPAKAAVEIVDGRAFLGLRDLATTLGISNINYDATTKTATLN